MTKFALIVLAAILAAIGLTALAAVIVGGQAGRGPDLPQGSVGVFHHGPSDPEGNPP